MAGDPPCWAAASQAGGTTGTSGRSRSLIVLYDTYLRELGHEGLVYKNGESEQNMVNATNHRQLYGPGRSNASRCARRPLPRSVFVRLVDVSTGPSRGWLPRSGSARQPCVSWETRRI